MLNDAVNQSQQTDLPKDLAFLTEQLSHLTDEFPFEVVSKIRNEIKLLEERGYSTKEMETKLHRSLAFPF